MRSFLLIIILIVSVGGSAFTQGLTKKKLLIYPPFRIYFFERPSLEKIDFTWHKGDLRIIITTFSPASDTVRSYNFNFLGDKYLFNKLYSSFDFPDSLMENEIDKKAVYYNFSGTIKQDSIFLVKYFYYPEKDVRFFERVETNSVYIKGKSALTQELQASIKDIILAEKMSDSIFLFTGITAIDSTYTHSRILVSANETYANAFINALNKSKPWRPAIQSGRPVKSYKKVFIRVNKDGTLTVDYSE